MIILRLRRRITAGLLATAALSLLQAQQPPATPPAQAPPAQAQPAQTQPAQQSVTVPGAFKFNGASLLEVIDILAGELHINYVVDPAVKGGTVTMTTYGTVRDVDIRPLLETILRMNNLAMVQVGEFYRIIPAGNIAKQPVSPVTQTDSSKLPDDERLVLNLVFLRYISSAEMYKVLLPYIGEGAQLTSYDPANLLLVLDNSRNMRRTLELISIFDNDAFAGQRLRAFDVKNERPTDMAKELEDIFKAYSFSGEKTSNAVRFIPVNRINVILAVAPNPGTFTQVESWIQKLDVPAKVTAGAIDNYVYKLKYAMAENVGGVITQLYGGCFIASGYGPTTGNSSYPAGGMGTGLGMGGGGFGGGGYNGGGGYGSPYGGGGYGGQSPYGNGGYGNGGFGGAFGGGGGYGAGISGNANCMPQASGYNQQATAAGPLGVPTTSTTPAPATAGADQTGSYLAPTGTNRQVGPRVVANSATNTLLVQGTPQEWEQIRHLLDQLDVAPRQVLIDAKIYEVDLTGAFALGVESALQPKGTATTQLLGTAGSAGLVLTSGFLVGQTRQLLATLTASESTSKARVLSAPSIIATDSIPASITVGSSVPSLSSEAVSPGLSVGGTSPIINSISNTSTGIGLTILARVNPSGVVTMVINQDVTAPIPNPLAASGAAGSGIDSPSFSQRNVSTQVTVEDGDTIAIGGIITENYTETSQGIPFLHRLPYIGAAFGSKTSSKQKTELIIFLTPRVIYDTTEITDATEELKQKVRGLRKLMQNDK